MRPLALAVALFLAAAGCRSTYHARADDLARATDAGGGAVVPAIDGRGEPVSLEVDSIVWTGEVHGDGRQVVRAADGRVPRRTGWILLLAGGGAGGAIAAYSARPGVSDPGLGIAVGMALATPFVLTALPLLTYGYVVGSPER